MVTAAAGYYHLVSDYSTIVDRVDYLVSLISHNCEYDSTKTQRCQALIGGFFTFSSYHKSLSINGLGVGAMGAKLNPWYSGG